MQQVRTTRVVEVRRVNRSGRMGDIEIRNRYCCSIPGILKWLEIVVCAIILALLCWENIREGEGGYSWLLSAEHYTVVVAILCMIITAVLLVVFFLNCHHGLCITCQCHNIAYVFFILAAIAFIVAGIVETWVAIEHKSWKGSWHRSFFERRVAAAVRSGFSSGLLHSRGWRRLRRH